MSTKGKTARRSGKTATPRVTTEETTFTVVIPDCGFRHCSYFNKFQAVWTNEGCVLYFWTEIEGFPPTSVVGFFAHVLDIEMNRERITKYVEQLETIEPGRPSERLPVPLPEALIPFRYIQTSRLNDVAEIMLLNFTLHPIVARRSKQEPRELKAEPVALLSSGASVHKACLLELFGGKQ